MKKAGWLVVFMLAITGCAEREPGDGTSDSALVASDVEQQQMMDRWNAIVAGTPVPTDGFSFAWPTFYQFPHPTYKGGSELAYWSFATLLLAFMQNGDNFDYLAEHKLFDVRLGYAMANGKVGQDWSLRELVTYFGSESAYGNIAEETRNGLAAVAARMEAAG